MNYSSMEQTQGERVTQFMYKVFGWMSAALATTAAVAYFIFNTPALYEPMKKQPVIALLLFVVQIVLVMSLAGFIQRMRFSTAFILFFLYAISVGFTFSVLFAVYTTTSIALTFFVTAGTFGTMALYGYVTKADLTSMGNIAMMALWGILIAMLVNIFLASSKLDFVVSIFGVIIFTALTAYDTQKLKELAMTIPHDETVVANKIALVGALTLYLDFINLFLFLLRFFGDRRRD